MTALAPASRTRAPEPHQHRPHAPCHPKIHSQMRLSDAPARGFHQAQPAQGCRPRPVQSHPPPRKLVATTTAIRWSTRTSDFLANEPFSFTASIPTTRSNSFLASFVPQIFHHPPTIPGSNLGSHTVSTHSSTSAVTRQHQCALAV